MRARAKCLRLGLGLPVQARAAGRKLNLGRFDNGEKEHNCEGDEQVEAREESIKRYKPRGRWRPKGI